MWYVAAGGTRSPKTVEGLRRLLLRQRGISLEAASHFFTPTYEQVVHDPLLLSDMDKAVDRIFQAIRQQQRIIVHGDYDADGISSMAILVSVLHQLGALAAPHVPHREDDGYGLNEKVLAALAPEMDLLIAVDCGITSVQEVQQLTKKKIDVIIIDHHTIPETLPAAHAIIHPRHPDRPYPFGWLCGAGLAWKTAQALLRDPRSAYHDDPDQEKWLLDLAVIGTVADIVPLQDENRAIVRFGLEILRRTKRPGLRTLLAATVREGNSLTAEDIAFRIVPRINAAGRIGHAQPALDLLLTESESRAVQLLTELNRCNQLRQTLTRRVIEEAARQVVNPELPFVFAASDTWPAGVVGLAAGQLSSRFNRPAIVVGRSGSRLVGSARSPIGTNVLELLGTGRAHLEKLGGHAQAAGFTVTKDALEAFQEILTAGVAQQSARPPLQESFADALISPALVSQATVDSLKSFAPFGEGNHKPSFILQGLSLLALRPVGKDQKHAKFVLRHNETVIDAIGFGLYAQAQASAAAPLVDLIGSIDENEYRGRRSIQLTVNEIAPTQSATIKVNHQRHPTH